MELGYEKLSSGKQITRQFAADGSLQMEMHFYGVLDIAIQWNYIDGMKSSELYFVKRRMVGRRTYEKARVAYSDMPGADDAIADEGAEMLALMRKQQRTNKAEAERRLAQSAEAKYPRPASTNWLRVMAGERAHLVEFTSRDWKVLSKERNAIPAGRDWLDLFGFGRAFEGDSVADGLIVGYEVSGNRESMLTASRKLLEEVRAYTPQMPDPTWGHFSVRKKPKPRKPKPIVWPEVLPALIEFLESLTDVEMVKVFNHHR